MNGLLENFPVVNDYSLNFNLINCKTTAGKQIATATEHINQEKLIEQELRNIFIQNSEVLNIVPYNLRLT